MAALADRSPDRRDRLGCRGAHGTDYWTALVVAAAAHSGCRYLLTEALPHGQRMDAIQTVNPFLIPPEDLLAAAP